MQLTFDAEVEAFQAECIAFLDENLPSEAEAAAGLPIALRAVIRSRSQPSVQSKCCAGCQRRVRVTSRVDRPSDTSN